MASIAEGRKYLKLQEGREADALGNTLLEADGEKGPGVPKGLGGDVRGKEGFTSFMGPTAVNPINKRERDVMREMEDDFNKSLSQFASTQTQLMEDTKRYVEITAPGRNRYARKMVKFRNGWVGYVTRYGEVKLLPVRPGPDGDASPADWTSTFLAGMEKRPGCGGVMSIPADFPSVDGRQLPAPGTPIKVDGMTAELFYGGPLPVDKSWNKFGIPCGMEGDNLQVTMMADSQAMWAATQKGKRVGEDTVEAGIYARPMAMWPSAADHAPAGDQAFIGCVRKDTTLQEQPDLGVTSRFDCFTRAVDLGASAYGLAGGEAAGPHARGTCYVTKNNTVNVVAGLQRADKKACSLWTDKTSYRYATTTRRATIDPTVIVVPRKTADSGLSYGLSLWGRLLCTQQGAVQKSIQGAAAAKSKYWHDKWDIDAKINKKEGQAQVAVTAEQLKLRQRTADLATAKNNRTATVDAANALLDQASKAQTKADRDAILKRAQEADDAVKRAGKAYVDATKALAKEEKAVAKASQKETESTQGLEGQRTTEQEKNSITLRKAMAKIKDGLYKSVLLQLPVGGETSIEQCVRTSEYVGSCYTGVALTLEDDGTLALGSAEDYHKNGGRIKNPSWSWSSGELMGIALPDLVGCSSHVGVVESDMDPAVPAPLISPDTTLVSPSGKCRVVMRVDPVMVDVEKQVPPHRDAQGTWQPASMVTEQVPDPEGSQKVFLELQWFTSDCAGIHDADDIQSIDPRDQGQAAGKTPNAIALHQVPGLPTSPWQDSARAQSAYYVPAATLGTCASKYGAQPTKLPYGANTRLGKTYTQIPGYDTGGNDISGAQAQNVSLDVCQEKCNEDARCGGVVYKPASKECFPKTTAMFPAGVRQPAADSDIYIRHVKPAFAQGSVCPSDVSASTVYQMGSFDTAEQVSPDMPCDLAAAAGCDQKPIEEAAEKLKQKRGAMLAHVQELSQADSRLVAELGYNVDRLKNDIDSYNETVSRSGELSGGAMVAPQAHQEDTDLQMIQENYRYLLWTIGAVIVASVGIRMARS